MKWPPVSKCEGSRENWGPVSWCSQILGATSIENTMGSDPCGQPHCILLCLLWPREGGGSHLVVLSEDHETGPHPRAAGRPWDWTPVFPGHLALADPDNIWIHYEKWLENAKQKAEKRPETSPNWKIGPSLAAKSYFTRTSPKCLRHRNFSQKENDLQGWPR